MSEKRSKFMLVIESAIGGGSIALFDDKTEIDNLVGPTGMSRAEDLLPNIDRVLEGNDIDGALLKQIIVGAGPGSFTGIRIGISTALGLSAAFGIPVRRLSTLIAISLTTAASDEKIVALPVGRETICVQSFSFQNQRLVASSKPETVSQTDFFELISLSYPKQMVVNGSIFATVPAESRSNLLNAGENLASHLGRAALETDIADLAEPLFIGKRK